MILDCTTGPRGRISAEVKLRRVRDQVHLEKVRKLARKDCNTVWDAAVSETPGVYGGQLLLLYSFPVVGDTWVSRADFRNAGGSWSPLWGWGAPKMLHQMVTEVHRHVWSNFAAQRCPAPPCLGAPLNTRKPRWELTHVTNRRPARGADWDCELTAAARRLAPIGADWSRLTPIWRLGNPLNRWGLRSPPF